ncbi:CapA family protein [Bacillus sp. BGMRC 2118]|nr:CapA family protein [Bacillus sp. BGMRC 2118]
MSKRTRLLGYSTLVLTILLFTFVFIDRVNTSDTKEYTVQSHSNRTEKLSAKDFKSSATITAVGDILIHSLVYNSAKTTAGYDFKPMFSDVKPMLEAADITVANQETMIGGHEIGLSTYPSFNSPFEVGDALKDAGVDIVTIANNHTIDRGEKAIQNALNHYNKIGMPYTGAYSSPEDQTVIRTLKKNGITFSFLAYTYGTNGIPVPKDKPYLVNLIDLNNIERDIKLAKQESDVVVVSLHFGNEYQRMPNDEQRNIAKTVINQGADIILGHHPHVLQPMEWIEAEDGHKGFVIYSLGNFLSSQKSIYREIGGILTLTVNKEIQDGKTIIDIKNPEFQSTYVSRTHRYKIVPLEKAASYGLTNAPSMFNDIQDHMYKLLPDTEVAQAN